MANSYKNIIITTNRGSSNDDPKIVFSGANTSVNTDVTLKVYPDSNGTLSFEGSAGQLFSITNDLTGSIFSVNDVSGIPSIDVNANGNISLAPYNGKVGIGTLSPIANLHVIGSANITSNATFGNYVFVGTPAATANGLVDIRATDRTPGPALYIKSTWDTINDALDKGLVIDSVGGAQPYLFTIRSGGSPVVRYHNYTGATEFWTSGSMRATTYKFNVDTDGYIDSPADGTITIGTNNFERMRIDSSGRVGIGTSSPSAKLTVANGNLDLKNSTIYTRGGTAPAQVYNAATFIHEPFANGNLIDAITMDFMFNDTVDNPTTAARFHIGKDAGYQNGSVRSGFLSFYTRSADILAEKMRITNAGNVGIANTAPEARLHVYGANNSSTALKVTTRGSDDGATRKGVEVVPSSGPNSTYYAFYADVVGHSANYGLYINNGRAYIKDLTYMLGNARITGVRDSNYGTLQIGDTTSGYSAGLGGHITFWGDTVGQGSARNAFAGIKGVKENGTYFNLLGALIFETQTDNSTGDGTTLTEKMRITSGGNVGIGTTSPTTKLDLRFGTAGTTLRSQIYHTDNTDATSHSILQIMTGGASGGDPHIFFGVAGVGDSGWNIGLDNSDGDKFKISGPFGDVGGLGTSDRFVINSSGNVGIGTTTPTALLDANTDIIRIRTSKTPASTTATGNQGDICWDSNYIYVCTAANTWVRANLSTW